MKSYPSWEDVRTGLGDKVVAAFAEAAAFTRVDLGVYRNTFPAWVARSSERGLANWIHDAFWAHLSVLLDGVYNVVLVDREPKREVHVGYTYRIRIKRHHLDGHVSTYPTQEALDFLAQEEMAPPFDGMAEIHLIAGYEWDQDLRAVGDAVVSLREGSVVIWQETLPWIEPGEGGGTAIVPAAPAPTPPSVTDPKADNKKDQADSE